MRSFITLSVFASGALAAWNPKICNNSGGCVGTTWNPPDPFVCPDGTRLNIQQTAHNEIDAQAGNYQIVTKAQFPSSCLNGAKPLDSDILTVHTTQFGQKMYAFLRETCNVVKPAQNCYSAYPNPTSETLCQLLDSNGKQCIENPNAGECESWGGGPMRPQCNYWSPGKPDLPRES